MYSHRQPISVHSRRDRQCRKSGQIGSDCVNVRKIHGKRISGLFSKGKGRRGRGGGHDDIAPGKGIEELLADQGLNLAGLAVEGLLVAGGKGEGPQKDPALHFEAKPLVPCLFVHLPEICGACGPEAIADTIEAAQI